MLITSKNARYMEHLFHAGTVSKIVETTDPSPQPNKNTNIIATQGRGRWVGREYVTYITQFSLFNRQILF